MSSHRPSALSEPEILINIQFSFWQIFKPHIPRFILTTLVDVVLPLLIYFLLQKHIKPVYALVIAGTPPLLMVISKAILSRTFDALGFLIALGFIISGVVAIITRNPVIILLEKSLITGILSVIFALTLIPLTCCHHRCRLRPLGYYFYQDLVPTNRVQIGLPANIFDSGEYSEHDVLIPKLSDREEIAKVYEWLYENCSSFRISCYVITSVWSIGFLGEFLTRLTLILVHLSVNKIVLYGNLILTIITVICTAITITCITKERKQTLILVEQWKNAHLNQQID